MKITTIITSFVLAGCLLPAADAASASSMKEGAVTLKSAGPIAFGPDGVLLVADTKAAAIVAIDTADLKSDKSAKPLKVEGINTKVAALLGTTADQIIINDIAVNPASRNVYMAVSRGTGPDAAPVLVRVGHNGQPEVV